LPSNYQSSSLVAEERGSGKLGLGPERKEAPPDQDAEVVVRRSSVGDRVATGTYGPVTSVCECRVGIDQYLAIIG
jgi:hypothetical protein